MSVFSEYLTVIKNKRNLSSAEVAEICGLGTTVVFRWMKGERIPDNIEKLRLLELKLRLSEEEKNNLEDAYMITLYGRKKYDDFKSVNRIIAELRKCIDDNAATGNMNGETAKTEGTENIAGPELNGKYANGDNENKNNVENEFKVIKGKKEIIYKIEQYCEKFRKKSGKKISTINSSVNEEINAILRFYCNESGCDIEQIYYTHNDVVIYGKNKILNLLLEVAGYAFKENNINVYTIMTDNFPDNNCIISENFFIHYNNDLTEGIFTTYPELIRMQSSIFDFLKSKSSSIGKNEVEIMDVSINNYLKNSFVKCVEYQPCVNCTLNREIMEKHIIESIPNREKLIDNLIDLYVVAPDNKFIKGIKIFFSEQGLHKFMQEGRMGMVPYQIYAPFDIKERCYLLTECVKLSKQGTMIHYMIKDDKEINIEKKYIEYVENDETSQIRMDVENDEGKTERLNFVNEQITEGFGNFFECFENEKYVYSREETEDIMMKVVEEYKSKYNIEDE